MDRGKQFEREIYNSLIECPEVAVDRFYDPQGGYLGVANCCDFSVYRFPSKFYFECKARAGNTLNFKGDITPTQWTGLLDRSYNKGVYAGILVWFIDHDITAFVNIRTLDVARKHGYKSLNVKDIIDQSIYSVPAKGKKKKILFSYDGKSILDDIEKFYTDLWGTHHGW